MSGVAGRCRSPSPPAWWRDFCQVTAKTVTAEDGASWVGALAEPFPALLGDVAIIVALSYFQFDDFHCLALSKDCRSKASALPEEENSLISSQIDSGNIFLISSQYLLPSPGNL